MWYAYGWVGLVRLTRRVAWNRGAVAAREGTSWSVIGGVRIPCTARALARRRIRSPCARPRAEGDRGRRVGPVAPGRGVVRLVRRLTGALARDAAAADRAVPWRRARDRAGLRALAVRLMGLVSRLRRRAGGRAAPPRPPPADEDRTLASMDDADRRIVEAALPYTMTGPQRLHALVVAVRWCLAREVPGAFAECGVWRGGSVLAMIATLLDAGVTDRDIHLYDTFEGMTEPTDADTSPFDAPARSEWEQAKAAGSRAWEPVFGEQAFSEASVRELLATTAYPPERLHVVRGPVEETLRREPPGDLALLRLDTDWHVSSAVEMEVLYPRLASGGVLIVDDYGHWAGARAAVDEYFAAHGPAPLLCPIDYT